MADLPLPSPERDFSTNRLLRVLRSQEQTLVGTHLVLKRLRRGQVLFEPGEEVETTYFPCHGTVASMLIVSATGREVEAANIGWEGAVGGIVSAGSKPAYSRAVVQIGGPAYCVATARLEDAKQRSPFLHDVFCRYADALLAQIMQSVACNALHTTGERCSRWLLSTQDRVQSAVLPLTQQALAEMLGVQRTTITAVVKELQANQLIRYRRGRIEILNRNGIEKASCECYAAVEDHATRLLRQFVA
ncbi:MAG TPA: Crp/Fnr family transcriptional regulator [Micropepsaceae bacterium]|nr:Crp/Fnr family transcriptional regulator [Micropepsaceae bacterium]